MVNDTSANHLNLIGNDMIYDWQNTQSVTQQKHSFPKHFIVAVLESGFEPNSISIIRRD